MKHVLVSLVLACIPMAAVASLQISPPQHETASGGGVTPHRQLFDVKFVLVKAPSDPHEPGLDFGDGRAAITSLPLSPRYVLLSPIHDDPNMIVCRGWWCGDWPH